MNKYILFLAMTIIYTISAMEKISKNIFDIKKEILPTQSNPYMLEQTLKQRLLNSALEDAFAMNVMIDDKMFFINTSGNPIQLLYQDFYTLGIAMSLEKKVILSRTKYALMDIATIDDHAKKYVVALGGNHIVENDCRHPDVMLFFGDDTQKHVTIHDKITHKEIRDPLLALKIHTSGKWFAVAGRQMVRLINTTDTNEIQEGSIGSREKDEIIAIDFLPEKEIYSAVTPSIVVGCKNSIRIFTHIGSSQKSESLTQLKKVDTTGDITDIRCPTLPFILCTMKDGETRIIDMKKLLAQDDGPLNEWEIFSDTITSCNNTKVFNRGEQIAVANWQKSDDIEKNSLIHVTRKGDDDHHDIIYFTLKVPFNGSEYCYNSHDGGVKFNKHHIIAVSMKDNRLVAISSDANIHYWKDLDTAILKSLSHEKVPALGIVSLSSKSSSQSPSDSPRISPKRSPKENRDINMSGSGDKIELPNSSPLSARRISKTKYGNHPNNDEQLNKKGGSPRTFITSSDTTTEHKSKKSSPREDQIHLK